MTPVPASNGTLASLVAQLARRRIPLTMCPLSNLKLQVIPAVAAHPLKRLLDAGLCVTVNSDDPSYFGGYVNDNLVQVFEALPTLGPREAYAILRNSFEGAFVDDDDRRLWIEELDTVFAAREP